MEEKKCTSFYFSALSVCLQREGMKIMSQSAYVCRLTICLLFCSRCHPPPLPPALAAVKQTTPGRRLGGERTHGRRVREQGLLKREGVGGGGREVEGGWDVSGRSLSSYLHTLSQRRGGRMFWPAEAANGRRGAAPSVRAGSAGGSVCLNLKSVFTGWPSIVELSFLSSHGCADGQDEDPGVAPHL